MRTWILAASLVAALAPAAAAQEIWSGRDFVFTKPDSADWTLPEHQDRITPTVWLTRAHNQGVFNIAQEEGYTPFVSPVGTEWATGDAVDWPNLTFAPWQTWAGSQPPNMVGVDAVVHLIEDDIYCDIRFESWTPANGGGGFSYARAAQTTAVDGVPAAAPALAAHPNPFNPTTTVTFTLERAQHGRVAAYDLAGRRVATLASGDLAAGEHRLAWMAAGLASGCYVVRLETAAGSAATRVALVR